MRLQASKCIAMLALLQIGLLSGCSMITPVKPWERGTLAKPSMALEPDGMEATFRSHIYFAKEASSGGGAAHGGGCGCN